MDKPDRTIGDKYHDVSLVQQVGLKPLATGAARTVSNSRAKSHNIDFVDLFAFVLPMGS